jgi:hypothetical protein
MSIVTKLVDGLREVCSRFWDKRSGTGQTKYTMADIGMSAFSLFFMQGESFLAYQRNLALGKQASNCHTLFGMKAIPSDNHIRNMLDPVHPSHLQASFDHAVALLQEHGGRAEFQVLESLGGRTPIALDGTEYFCSQTVHCPCCQKRQRSNGKTEHYHAMLSATIVAPGHNRVVPLMPEFITPQDGHDKQDSERAAARRWLSAHHARVKALRPLYLGDDLFACHPLASAILETGADFLLVCKPESHKTLYDFIDGATLKEHKKTRRLGAGRTHHCHYRWIEAVPLRDGKEAFLVNWFSIEIRDNQNRVVYKNAFVTNLPISVDNVVELATCGRARWKIENGSFNVLKNHGYALERNFGHGKQYLAMMFAAMNMPAFAFHSVCDCIDALWRKAREQTGARQRFFQHLHTITAYLVFPSWLALLDTLVTSNPPSPS